MKKFHLVTLFLIIACCSMLNAQLTTTLNIADVTCNGICNGLVTPSTTGGTGTYTHLWSNGSTNSTETGLCSGVYCVTVTDAVGATSVNCATITEPTAIVPTVSVSSAISSTGNNDGEATVIASGGVGAYIYAWDAAAGNQITSVATGLAAGIYCVTVVDGNGCSASACVNLSNPSSSVSATISSLVNASCNGACDGTATVSASGGTGGVSFAWDAAAGNQLTTTATGLCAGTYCVTVMDAVGATAANCVTILEPTVIVAMASVSSAISTNGNNDGEATVTASGGAGAYTFAWDAAAGNQITSVATGLAAGVYCVTVMDANGCSAATCISLSNPPSGFSATITSLDASCNGACDGSAAASSSGGTGAVSFAWGAAAGNQVTPTGNRIVCRNILCNSYRWSRRNGRKLCNYIGTNSNCCYGLGKFCNKY